MPHPKRSRAIRHRNPRRSEKDEGKTSQDVPLGKTLGYTLAIPDFKPQKVIEYTFRWTQVETSLATPYTTAWTTQMMLDIYCVAVGGGSVQPCRLFNAMKLKSVKMWTGGPAVGDSFGLEFSPALVGGYAGAPRIPVLATKVVTGTGDRTNFIVGKPRKDELAGQWFTAQQPSYTLFNLAFPATIGEYTNCLELCFDTVMVNGETPAVTSFVTSAAKGTIGTGNFSGYSVTGWRSVGLVNLATP